MRELQTEAVSALLEELIAAQWRPGQLRHLVGAPPTQSSVALQDSVERDAAHLVGLLRALLSSPSPDALQTTPPPTEWLREREPSCSLCADEGAFFVTDDVHLCSRCVSVLATGQARLTDIA